MTEKQKMVCPQEKPCTPRVDEYPFYYPPCCLRDTRVEDTENFSGNIDVGVYADVYGDLSNTWVDGTVGVPAYIEEDPCMPSCTECWEEAVYA